MTEKSNGENPPVAAESAVPPTPPDGKNPDQVQSYHPVMRDGMAYAVTLGAGETFLGPFGIFLNGTLMQIGVLGTLPHLFGAIGQGVGVWFIERFPDRKRALLRGTLLNALSWVLIALLPFAFSSEHAAVNALIIGSALYFATNGFTAPVWSSLVGDLVPSHIRGRFFGYRNRVCGTCTFAALFLAGQALDLTAQYGVAAAGFILIFGVALLARLVSRSYLSQYANPTYVLKPEQRFTFWQFIKRSPRSNFAKFVFFSGTINFGAAFSAPYFAVYMLRDLQLSYHEFTLLSAVQTVTQFVLMQYWGGFTDRFGNKKILNICGVGICVSPLLWLFSTDIWFLLGIQLYSGFMWAGYNLASTNFIFDAVSPPKLPRCAAYHAFINAAFFVAGSTAGGYLATHLEPVLVGLGVSWRPASPLLIVFCASGLLRLLGVVLLLPRFKEVRTVEPIKNRELFLMVANLRPIAGATYSVIMKPVRKLRQVSKHK